MLPRGSVWRKALTGFSHGRPSSFRLQASSLTVYSAQLRRTGLNWGQTWIHSPFRRPSLVHVMRTRKEVCVAFPETLPTLHQQKNPAPNLKSVGDHNTRERTYSSFFEEHSRSVVRSISGADVRQPLQPPVLSSGVQPPLHSRVRVHLASFPPVIKSEQSAVRRGGITTYVGLLFAPSSPSPFFLVVEFRPPPFYL